MSEVWRKATSLMRANQSPGAYLSPADLCSRGENGNSLNGEMAHLSGVLTTPLRATMACSLRVSLKSHL